MMLYRYMSAEYALQALQCGSWKIGRLLELNDPMDCQPRFTFRGSSDCDPANLPSIYREIGNQVGILCYSESINDPVLWSHYANAHRGIALGFDLGEHEATQIEYRNDNLRAEVDLDAIKRVSANVDEALDATFTIGYSRKTLSWQYEAEWRQFVKLSQCRMVGTHYFKKMPIESLRRIVLGVRCPFTPFDISVVLKNSVYNPDATIWQASMDQTSYMLKMEKTLYR